MAIIKKKLTSVVKDVGKREYLCTVGWNVNTGTATMENSIESSQKMKNRTVIDDPASHF